MDYPGNPQSGAYAEGFTNKFKIDSKLLGAATSQLRGYVQQNVYDGLSNEIDRITKYYLYWNYYEGRHYREWNDAMLAFNYVRAFIDKVVMFLLGKDVFTLHVQDIMTEQVDKEIEEWAEKAIMYNWNKSMKKQISYEILQMGSVCGDCWVGTQWNKEGKFVRVRLYDSRQCFPMFKNGNVEELESFILRIPLVAENNPSKYKLFCYEFTDKKVTTWYQKGTGSTDKEPRYEEKSEKNPYGFIPIVHIKNKPFGPGYFSKSDANDILKVNKVYNELMQQEKGIIDYHATPTTVITGANSKGLQRGLGKIWSGLPPEANVFNLGLDVDMSGLNEFLKTLKMGMHELSDVPENALGKIQAISNTSGAALAITYQPLVQQADLKGICYGAGFIALNTMILKVHNYHNAEFEPLKKLKALKEDFIDTLYVCPVFSYGLPTDRQNELNMGVSEIAAGIASKHEVMERLGKNNIPELLEEIDEEKVSDAKLQAQTTAMMMEAQGLGGGGENGENPKAPDGKIIVKPSNGEAKKPVGQPAKQ